MTEQHRSAIESLAEEARGAAAKGYFVYPAPDDPDAVTGYRKVLELEDQDGPSEEPGEQNAAELRTEFAATLTRLGDTYYDREGGRAFAADYYAAALIFDPDNEHARSRTTLTPGELSSLRDKAAIGEFSESELAAAASLEVLALEDQQARIEQLTALYSGDNAPSPSTSARLEALLGGAEAQAIEAATVRRHAKKGKAKNAPNAAAAAPMPEYPPRAPEPAAKDVEGEVPAAGASVPSEEPVGQADPGRARDLAKEGIAEFKKGRFAQAEALLHRSLAHKRHNATALGALAELYFEQGSYQKAVQFAAKAVNLAPRSGKYRIILGDAYFKTLAYASARREYEKAKELGHGSAGSRLVELDKRLGK
jgi:tetratricopeptide (TPR) repeat protein